MKIPKYINLAVIVLIAFAFGFTVLNYPASPQEAEKAKSQSITADYDFTVDNFQGDIPINADVCQASESTCEKSQTDTGRETAEFYANVSSVMSENRNRTESNPEIANDTNKQNFERYDFNTFDENVIAFKGFNTDVQARAKI